MEIIAATYFFSVHDLHAGWTSVVMSRCLTLDWQNMCTPGDTLGRARMAVTTSASPTSGYHQRVSRMECSQRKVMWSVTVTTL